MSRAPEAVIEAVLVTLKYATVYCRNYTLQSGSQLQQINEIMEAIHDLPDQMYNWEQDGLKKIRLHLRCFDHTKWTGAPNLEDCFNGAYERASAEI